MVVSMMCYFRLLVPPSLGNDPVGLMFSNLDLQFVYLMKEHPIVFNGHFV